jgi:hypothetical protein
METTGMELAIKITLVLLILSLIVEKITGFVKLYFPSLYSKTYNEEEEKLREKKIQRDSIIIGVIVAIISNANFFKLLRGQDMLYWTDDPEGFTIKAILGCLISGIFLSQGSKFFHDLLDTLLYAKKMKRGLFENQDMINNQIRFGENLDSNELLMYAIKPEDRDDDDDVSS